MNSCLSGNVQRSPGKSPADSRPELFLSDESETSDTESKETKMSKDFSNSSQMFKRHNRYHPTSDAKREQLIDCVENRNEKIKKAAKRLNINYSTAKSIINVYKKEGRSSKKLIKKKLHKGSEEIDSSYKEIPIYSGDQRQVKIVQENDQFGINYNINDDNNGQVEERDTLGELRERLLRSRNREFDVEGAREEFTQRVMKGEPLDSILSGTSAPGNYDASVKSASLHDNSGNLELSSNGTNTSNNLQGFKTVQSNLNMNYNYNKINEPVNLGNYGNSNQTSPQNVIIMQNPIVNNQMQQQKMPNNNNGNNMMSNFNMQIPNGQVLMGNPAQNNNINTLPNIMYQQNLNNGNLNNNMNPQSFQMVNMNPMSLPQDNFQNKNIIYMVANQNNFNPQQQQQCQMMPMYVINSQPNNMSNTISQNIPQNPIQFMQPIMYVGPDGVLQQGFIPTGNFQNIQGGQFQNKL